MSRTPWARFSARHVEAFVEKIAADRDRDLADIAERLQRTAITDAT